MKKQILSLILAGASIGAYAATAGNIKVFINPGHGGHDSDDRNVVIEPYAAGDPNGYWESNSNLEKGLALRDQLEAKGYQVKMSRVTNTTADDLGLSTISALANNYGADIFFSIHSNATGTAARRNFPLMLFRGYDNQPVKPQDKVVATILNTHLLENQVTYWTSTSLNVRGDWSFYDWGTSGLGVLRNLTVIGMLSEGSFHDYIPEAYRLMNKEFCWLEAYHFRRAIDEYFSVAGESKGHIFGRLNDIRIPRSGNYLMYGDDTFATVQGATVELYNASGSLVKTYKTESINTNGVYAFTNLEPGTYTVKTKVDTHFDEEATVEVKADLVTYANFKLSKVRNTPPEVLSYSPVWNEGDEPVLCNTPVVFNFNWDMDVELTPKAFKIEPAVQGTFTWEDLNYRMVFTPNEPYNTNTLYTVTLSTEAAHGGGTKMQQAVTFKFKTTDRNFMSILAQAPSEDALVHYQNAAIELRFDKKPNTTNILKQVSCVDETGAEVKFNNRGLVSNKANVPYGFFRLPFSSDLVPGRKYTVNISGDLADKDGITIQKPLSITFTAYDAGAEKQGSIAYEFDNAKEYVFDEEKSNDVESQSVVADSKTHLFGSASVSFTYSFENTKEGEAMWSYTGSDTEKVTRIERLGVHVNGDLSGNPLYLLFSSEISERYVHVADMDFLGWRYIEVPLTELEGDGLYTFKGVKVVQAEGDQTRVGTFELDRIYRFGESGIENVELASLTVGPIPASEYLIASAGFIIESISLYDLDGRLVAATSGNALYVGDIQAGNYLAVVGSANGPCVRKVIIAH